MDRDTESIGGIKNPMEPTMQLHYATIIMDFVCIMLAFAISWQFATGIFIYILFSRLYSYRGVRLKRFPVIGYLTVIINQGALIFALVYYAAENNAGVEIPMAGLIASSFLIGGFYPITQVYQHKADANDGVTTISMMLGIRGTFIFCALMYAVAFGILFFYFNTLNNIFHFMVLQLFFIPVIIYFLKWFTGVIKNENIADFKNTMRMNILASTCTNLAFITLITLNQIG